MVHILGKEDLEKLPSKLMYDSFDKADGNCVDSHIYDGVEHLINKQDWLNDHHNKIRNVFCYVYKNKSTKEFNNTDCDYLYFWLGYVLHSDLTYSIYFRTVMNTLKFLLNSIGLGDICTYDNYDYYNITFEDFRNIKKLFDFSKDYDMLKEYISKGNRFCNKDFYDYVIPYIITYNLFKSQCKNGNRGEATCSAFYNYFNDKTEEDLSQWTFTLDKRNTNNVTQKEAHGRVSQPNVQGINIVEEHKSEKILGHEINTNPYIYQSVYESTEIKHLNDQQSEDFYSVHRTQELRAHIDMSVSPSGSTSKSLVIPPLAIGITVFSIILCKVLVNVNIKVICITLY